MNKEIRYRRACQEIIRTETRIKSGEAQKEARTMENIRERVSDLLDVVNDYSKEHELTDEQETLFWDTVTATVSISQYYSETHGICLVCGSRVYRNEDANKYDCTNPECDSR